MASERSEISFKKIPMKWGDFSSISKGCADEYNAQSALNLIMQPDYVIYFIYEESLRFRISMIRIFCYSI